MNHTIRQLYSIDMFHSSEGVAIGHHIEIARSPLVGSQVFFREFQKPWEVLELICCVLHQGRFCKYLYASIRTNIDGFELTYNQGELVGWYLQAALNCGWGRALALVQLAL